MVLSCFCFSSSYVFRCDGVYWEKGSTDPSGNWDGLCGVKAVQWVCLQQPQHQGHVRLWRKLQHMKSSSPPSCHALPAPETLPTRKCADPRTRTSPSSCRTLTHAYSKIQVCLFLALKEKWKHPYQIRLVRNKLILSPVILTDAIFVLNSAS